MVCSTPGYVRMYGVNMYQCQRNITRATYCAILTSCVGTSMTLSCWLGFRIGAPPPLREWLCRENKTCQIDDMHKHLCNNNTNMFTFINACAGMQTGKPVSMYMHVCTKTQHTLLSLPGCLSSLGSRGKPPLMGPVASPTVFLTRPIAPG